MTTYRRPKRYKGKYGFFQKENYLFSGFNYNIHVWNVTKVPLDPENRVSSLGYKINSGDVLFSWKLSPTTFCLIKLDNIEEFLELIQEAIEMDDVEEQTSHGDLHLTNTRNQSIYSLGTPVIKIDSSNLFAFDRFNNEDVDTGFTDTYELQRLYEWFNSTQTQNELASAIL